MNDNLFKWTSIIIAICSIISIVCMALLFWKYNNTQQLEQPKMLMPWTPYTYNDKGEPTVNGWMIK